MKRTEPKLRLRYNVGKHHIDLDYMEKVAKAADQGEWEMVGWDDIEVWSSQAGVICRVYGREDQHFISTFSPEVVLALLAKLKETKT